MFLRPVRAHIGLVEISCADLPPRCFLTGGCDGYAKIWKFQSAKPTPGREPLASWNGKEQLDSIRRYGRDDMGCHGFMMFYGPALFETPASPCSSMQHCALRSLFGCVLAACSAQFGHRGH